MTERERDGLVVLLAAVAGSVDAWSYVSLGHVFVANMTGNTVLLGLAASQAEWQALARPLLALLAYGGGVVAGALLTRNTRAEQRWSVSVTAVLALEVLLLSAVAALWWASSVPGGTHQQQQSFIGASAFALGLQSAAMQALRLPGVVTTYITGTWTTLWRGLARFVTGSDHTPEERKALGLQASVLVTYGSAACGAGLLAHSHPFLVPTLPVTCLWLVILLSVGRG